jgi:hypothetical protein
VNGIDALAVGIIRFEGQTLANRNYRNSNPGNLRNSPLAGRIDDSGYAVFQNISTGYLALVRDLVLKFQGKSSHGIAPDSTLLDLIHTYAPGADGNNPNIYTSFLVGFLQHWRQLPKLGMTPLRDIWTPEEGYPWDSRLNSYLNI